jgi:hypothetical protein
MTHVQLDFKYDSSMKPTSVNLSAMILRKLAGRDMRRLVLTVSIRRSLAGTIIKGDLAAKVESVLRSLVASKSITDTDGTYSLCACPTVA